MAKQPSIADRLGADSFPHPVTHLRRLETAISWIVLTGAYAYKIKKPLRLPFIDSSTLERREFLCREELRLNRRFTTDLYLDVLPISDHDGQLRVGPADRPIEYAVQMREFDAADELAAQLGRGRVEANELAQFGRHLSHWHQSAPAAQAADSYGTPELIRAQAQENFDTLLARVHGADAATIARLERWTDAELLAHLQEVELRASAGRVRECHGDLHAGNIVRWQGAWAPFDCIEFDPRLRWIDVISDMAFLFMDLLAHGRDDLAYGFVSAYLEQCGDYAGLRLLPFYSVYRALVRAKVAALSLEAPVPAADLLASSPQARLQRRLAAAERLAYGGSPALLLMHGVTASGKSHLSSLLIGAAGAIRVRSDVERRRLFGAGAYSTEATDATYERLRICAQHALESGYRVIVDATFLEPARRGPLQQLAQQYGCPLLIISCHAPRSVLEQRIAERARNGSDASEATAAVLAHQLRLQSGFDERERPYLIEVDTSSAEATRQGVAIIQTRLS